MDLNSYALKKPCLSLDFDFICLNLTQLRKIPSKLDFQVIQSANLKIVKYESLKFC